MRDVFDENRSHLLYMRRNMMDAIAQKHLSALMTRLYLLS